MVQTMMTGWQWYRTRPMMRITTGCLMQGPSRLLSPLLALFVVVATLMAAPADASILPADKDVLCDLFDSTNGPSWFLIVTPGLEATPPGLPAGSIIYYQTVYIFMMHTHSLG